MEYRQFNLKNLQVETRGKDELPRITGHAAVFNSVSVDFGGWKEVIAPGAFTRTLASGKDIQALVEHDDSKMLARTKSGTLKLSEDDKGLKVDISPANTTWGRDLIEQVKRGDVDSFSFGFIIEADKWEDTADNAQLRTLLDVELFEVSAVSNPAYAGANDLALRNKQKRKQESARLLKLKAEVQERIEKMNRR